MEYALIDDSKKKELNKDNQQNVSLYAYLYNYLCTYKCMYVTTSLFLLRMRV